MSDTLQAPTEVWTALYNERWQGLIVDEATAHPAKFSRGLIRRIYRELIENHWLYPGQTVCDPFGGVGLGALDAMQHGLKWVGVELESRFCDLANKNLALWASYGVTGGRIVQGDSRKLREHVGGADVVCSSPPFAESLSAGFADRPGLVWGNARYGNKDRRTEVPQDTYGSTPGQLGAMRPGSVEAVVSSPPYADQEVPTLARRGLLAENTAYDRSRPAAARTYGQTPGNLGNMKPGEVSAVVSSPPYEGSLNTTENHDARAARTGGFTQGMKDTKYGDNPFTYLSKDPSGLNNDQRHAIAAQNPQVGALTGNTFWAASFQIIIECYEILKSGGVCVFVTKDFVRKGQRVPFSDDWERLCIACGFQPLKRVQASLVKETRHPGLFDEDVVKTTERKSFFRRLAEKKGSPRIDHEDVIFVRKP